jgi:hypothetical protein
MSEEIKKIMGISLSQKKNTGDMLCITENN